MSVDSDFTGLRRQVRASIRWVVPPGRGKAGMAFRRAAFSLCREALATKKEANFCWWESCYSFNRPFSCIRHWFMEVSESEGRYPIDLVNFLNR